MSDVRERPPLEPDDERAQIEADILQRARPKAFTAPKKNGPPMA